MYHWCFFNPVISFSHLLFGSIPRSVERCGGLFFDGSFRLVALRQEAFCFLLFCLDGIDLSFEMGARAKGDDSARRDHNFSACLWISSFARRPIPYRKHPKIEDADWFPFLKDGFK